MKILYGLLAMYGARCLWTALYRQNPALLERTLPEMITYGGALAGQLALQLAWAAALFALGRAAWHAVHRRMTVQGG